MSDLSTCDSEANIRDANLGASTNPAMVVRCSENRDREILEPNLLVEALNRLSVSSRTNLDQLSRNFAQGPRYEGDLDDDAFDLSCDEFLKGLQLSGEEIDSLEKRTIERNRVAEWNVEKRKRLPATAFGRVCYMSDTSFRNNFVRNLLSVDSQKPMPQKVLNAIEYGKNSKPYAIADYEEIMQETVKPCGLFVHPKHGFLEASPYALVGENGLLEIKFPYGARRIEPIKIPRYVKPFYCLSMWDSTIMLKKGHYYYFQIQGQLEITNRQFCDFVVCTRRGIHVERIFRDREFWNKMFPKLEAFYKLSLLPELVDPRIIRGLPIREVDFIIEHQLKRIASGLNTIGIIEPNASLSRAKFLGHEGGAQYNDSKLESDCQQFLIGLQLSAPEIDSLQIKTIGQRENESWKEERRKRLTASNFGAVFKMKDSTSRRRLIEKMLAPDGGFSTKAMQNGIINEPKAIEAYEKQKNEIVNLCGLFVHPQFGYLGASPDGLIGNDGLLEVKCPSSANRDYLQGVQGGGDGERRLKTNNNYFYQIQGQLAVTGRKFCDFVVWTPEKGIEHLERIKRDKKVWDKIFPKLEKFYKLSLLPELVDPRIPLGLPNREPDFVEIAKAAKMERKNKGNQNK